MGKAALLGTMCLRLALCWPAAAMGELYNTTGSVTGAVFAGTSLYGGGEALDAVARLFSPLHAALSTLASFCDAAVS